MVVDVVHLRRRDEDAAVCRRDGVCVPVAEHQKVTCLACASAASMDEKWPPAVRLWCEYLYRREQARLYPCCGE